MLDNYDHKTLKKIKGNTDERMIKYEDRLDIIEKLRFNQESSLLAVESDKGLESIIGNIALVITIVKIFEVWAKKVE